MTLARATAPRVWSRYVAIGDSFTEGLCDVDPQHPDRYAGWADRLAGHLGTIAEANDTTLHYANLAVRAPAAGRRRAVSWRWPWRSRRTW